VQRIGNGLPLRIEDRGLQCDEDASFHFFHCGAASPRYQLALGRYRCTPLYARRRLRRRGKHPLENRVDVPHLIVQIERLLDSAASTPGQVGIRSSSA
jgi:hypothetical protein